MFWGELALSLYYEEEITEEYVCSCAINFFTRTYHLLIFLFKIKIY